MTAVQRDELEALLAEVDRALEGLTPAKSAAASVLSRTSTAFSRLEAVRDELVALLAALPVDEPAPVRRVLYGCNPYGSRTTPDVDDLRAVTGRYGDGAAVRIFDGSGSFNPAPVDPSVGLIIASWKYDLAAFVAGPPVAEIRAAVDPLPAGSVVAFRHEPDVKNEDPDLTQQAQALWQQIIKAHRPDLVTAFIIGGWRFDPSDNKGGPEPWAPAAREVDVLGVDLDGTDPATPHRSYVDPLKPGSPSITDRVLAFIDKHGIGGWLVAEWCVKDDGSNPRGPYIADHGKAWNALGDRAPLAVAWFEWPKDTRTRLVEAGEVAALAALVKGVTTDG